MQQDQDIVEELELRLGAAHANRRLELEQENEAKTHWAQETEARLGKELEVKCQELAACVDLLHQAEQALESRTAWSNKLQEQISDLQQQVSLMKESRWIKLGRKFGLGPDLRAS